MTPKKTNEGDNSTEPVSEESSSKNGTISETKVKESKSQPKKIKAPRKRSNPTKKEETNKEIFKIKRRKKRNSVSNQLKKIADKLRQIRKNETPAVREARLADMKERARKRLANETEDAREERLARLRHLARCRNRNLKIKEKNNK